MKSIESFQPSDVLRLTNLTKGIEIADRIEIAGSGAKRSKGLLGRTHLEPGQGLWIIPCEAVHTFWMQFALDLVFLDRRLCVRKVLRNVRPWRLAGCLSAHSVVELPAGTVLDGVASAGDFVEFTVSAFRPSQAT